MNGFRSIPGTRKFPRRPWITPNHLILTVHSHAFRLTADAIGSFGHDAIHEIASHASLATNRSNARTLSRSKHHGQFRRGPDKSIERFFVLICVPLSVFLLFFFFLIDCISSRRHIRGWKFSAAPFHWARISLDFVSEWCDCWRINKKRRRTMFSSYFWKIGH